MCCYLDWANASANVFSWNVKSHGNYTVGLFLKISYCCYFWLNYPRTKIIPEEHRNYELLPTVGAKWPHNYYTAGCEGFNFLFCVFNSKGLKEQWGILRKGPSSEESHESLIMWTPWQYKETMEKLYWCFWQNKSYDSLK